MRFERRDIAWIGFFALILLGWALLYVMSLESGLDMLGRPGLWAEALQALCTGTEAGLAGFAAVFAMWAAMGAAMMLPTLVPVLSAYQGFAPRLERPGAGFAGLVLSYLLVWAGFAAVAAVLQGHLSRWGWIDGFGRAQSVVLQAGLLVLAGLWQFSRFKTRCQSACLSPMSFFLGRFRPGFAGGMRMGAEIGLVCLGCCWAIMLLAFVGGVMNLAWMGVATLFMVFEKLPQLGAMLRRPAGWLLCSAGLSLLVFDLLKGM